MGNIIKKGLLKPNDASSVRTVVPNHVVPQDTPPGRHPNAKYLTNKVKTTKYTVLSFIPKNLFEQFHRVANLYFIFIVLLNFVPQVNAIAKETAMLPVIGVLLVTAIKDGFEDYQRYRLDKKVNHLPCRVYSREENHYEKVEWQEVWVGDLVHLSCNEIIPADMILLRSSNENGLCYIETANLDGESNLKQREVVKQLHHQGDEFHPRMFTYTIECDLPNLEIYKFHGTLTNKLGEKISVNKNNILLRGCTLRNTDFVEGIVVYAGHDTKALLNNRGPRYKRSKLEQQINKDVIWCVVFLFIMCFGSALGTGFFIDQYEEIKEDLYFLPYNQEAKQSVGLQAFIKFWTFIILYQVMIPLPLYVTIELVKLGQVYFINKDLQLYYEPSDRPMECRALNITEDLGQVQYVFSDKTGTLTENQMNFRKCTISGFNYFPDIDDASNITVPLTDEPDEIYHQIRESTNCIKESNTIVCESRLKLAMLTMTLDSAMGLGGDLENHKIHEFFLHLAICNTVVVMAMPHHDQMDISGNKEGEEEEEGDDMGSRFTRTGSQRSLRRSSRRASVYSNSGRPRSFSSAQAPSQPSILPPGYEAESPDELAFVTAASAYGCRLASRTPNTVTVHLPIDGDVTLKVLHVLPFDSNRKRMSVIVQNPINDEYLLYVKGADVAVLSNLAPFKDDEARRIYTETQHDMEQYSRQGLRTLCLAKKVISKEEYKNWQEKQEAGEQSLHDREKLLFDLACQMESNLTLLGATGIEDKLQDGVPETIAALRKAGINVWVLTGDNQETALNIAYSCRLISYEQDTILLNARNRAMTRDLINSHLEVLENKTFGSHAYINSVALEPEEMYQNHVENRDAIIYENINRDVPVVGNNNAATDDAADSVPTNIPGVACVSPSYTSGQRNIALVVDGRTLGYALDQSLESEFLRLAQHCSSVLCVRATPFQKAALVKLVRDKLKKLTLAIGDGANDVSMIQTADIGIGISGQEGMQAIMASDFALARFRFLRRLLFVHGHWCYERLARMTLYMFYKNAVFIFLIMWYQIYSGFSGNPLVDDTNLLGFNLFYTSLPPIVFGIVDQCAPDHQLMSQPHLYHRGACSRVYKTYSYFICILDALWQSLVQFFIPYGVYYNSDVGGWEMSQTCNAACVIASLLHVCLETRYWHPVHWIIIAISIAVFYLVNFIICAIGIPPNNYMVIVQAMATPHYWLTLVITIIVALAPRYLWHILQGTFFPTSCEQAQQQDKKTQETSYASWSSSSSSASVVLQGHRHLAESSDTVLHSELF